MSFLSALSDVKFAIKSFASVGLDFVSLAKAGTDNALKAAFDAKDSTAAHEAALNEVVAENEKLSGEVSTLKASLASTQGHLKAFESQSGITVSGVSDEKGILSVEKLKSADDKRVAVEARKLLAASGHQPVAEVILVDPASKQKAIDPNLKGVSRTAAVFERQFPRK